MLLKTAYVFFIGLLFAVFVGVGIAAFYEAPTFPQMPLALQRHVDPSGTDSAKLLEEQEKYDKKQNDFQASNKIYSRNVSILALVFAILAVIVGVLFMKNLQIIADGLLLGGVFTLIYSIIRGFDAQDNKFRFLVVAISFGVALLIGYLKFIRASLKSK
jgi:hypothetical protein